MHVPHGYVILRRRVLVQLPRLVGGRVRVRGGPEAGDGCRVGAGLLAPGLGVVRGHGVAAVKGSGGVALVLELLDPALAEDEEEREEADADDDDGEDVVVEGVEGEAEAAAKVLVRVGITWSGFGEEGGREWSCLQECVDETEEHDGPAEPPVREGQLGRFLGRLPLLVVEEAEGELREEEEEDDDAEDLMRAAELAGLRVGKEVSLGDLSLQG